MLDIAREGDVIAVWRLDRLRRSLKDLIETVQALEQRGIELKSLKENIDTTTPTGKLMFHMMAALAEFERDVIRERTLAGLDAARARGRTGGRRKASETLRPEQLDRAKQLYSARQNSIAEIMALTGFKSRATSINTSSMQRGKSKASCCLFGPHYPNHLYRSKPSLRATPIHHRQAEV